MNKYVLAEVMPSVSTHLSGIQLFIFGIVTALACWWAFYLTKD